VRFNKARISSTHIYLPPPLKPHPLYRRNPTISNPTRTNPKTQFIFIRTRHQKSTHQISRHISLVIVLVLLLLLRPLRTEEGGVGGGNGGGESMRRGKSERRGLVFILVVECVLLVGLVVLGRFGWGV